MHDKAVDHLSACEATAPASEQGHRGIDHWTLCRIDRIRANEAIDLITGGPQPLVTLVVRWGRPVAHSFVVDECAIGSRFRASLDRVLTRFHNSE